uniref:Uncharacterized protein n=1 Tax=Oryza glaberrima TaxID=4538 RepID=I1PJX3_ORYGL
AVRRPHHTTSSKSTCRGESRRRLSPSTPSSVVPVASSILLSLVLSRSHPFLLLHTDLSLQSTDSSISCGSCG